MTGPVIEFESVAKAFRRGLLGPFVPALTSVSFQVAAGEACAFLGPNGAGKTTSIGILMGFLYADFGSVRVLGRPPGDVQAKQRIGFLPENFAFHKHLNADQLLRYHWKLAGGESKARALDGAGESKARVLDGAGESKARALDGAGESKARALDGAGESKARALDGAGESKTPAPEGGGENGADPDAVIFRLLSQVKLTSYYDLKIGRYSRGMMQRLGLAQALLAAPELLVLDEPTSGLDPAGRKEVRDLILSLKAEGKTIFLSSHLLAEVEQICDRAIIINEGRVIRAGTMEELLAGSGRVEIVVDQLPEAAETALRARFASARFASAPGENPETAVTVEREAHGVRITVAPEAKREAAEWLWAEGCDVISVNPGRNSLEDLFLKLVGPGGAAK
jgi:ABC-type multidrug transport system ATPase subunit